VAIFNRIKNPVDAEYRLTSCSIGSTNAVYSNCHMTGVVTGPGLAPVAVEHNSTLTPTAKWPTPGQTLPVTVDRDNPEKMRIRWDEMPTNRELASRYAQQEAAELAAQQGSGGEPSPNPSAAPATGVVGDASRAIPGSAGGGLTPEQAAAALSGNGGGFGLQQASGRVIAAHEVPVPDGAGTAPGGVVDLTLDVTPTSGAGYSTKMRISFSTPEKRAAIARVGRDLPLLVNPTAQDQVVIDTSRLV
jgi:hypothetical protein